MSKKDLKQYNIIIIGDISNFIEDDYNKYSIRKQMFALESMLENLNTNFNDIHFTNGIGLHLTNFVCSLYVLTSAACSLCAETINEIIISQDIDLSIDF